MRRQLTRVPFAAGVLGVVLSLGLAIVPPAAGPAVPFLASLGAPVAHAADDLALATRARYVVAPDDGVIRVTVDVTATNEKPNDTIDGLVTQYFYDAVNLAVQPEAARIRATQDGARLDVTTARRDGYRLVTIALRRDLYFGQSGTFRLSYDLPGGKPRSASDVRVGPAFASFLAWAFGDSGTVRIDVPGAFEVDISGAELEQTTSSSGVQVFRASTRNPVEWFAWVNARNDDGLTRERLELDGGDEVVVRAWPEDSRWRTRVTRVLADAIPELSARIGLPWPVDGALSVLEIHTPLLEGYAGFYNPQTDEITISEDLDDLTIVHEASHAWFNRSLFAERWITEGLAEEYAAQVVDAIGGEVPAAQDVDRDARAAFPLGTWPPPSAIRSDGDNAREQYGYDASFRVMREIVERTGADGMRRVFSAADARTTAYPGDAEPERSTRPNDWRRLVDLTEELAGADGIAPIVAEWALEPEDAAALDERAEARAAYGELRRDGDTWAPPVLVRMAMDRWAFEEAIAGATEASAILARRDAIEAMGSSQDLDPPGALEAAYESAASPTALSAVAALAIESESSLGLVAAAGNAVAAPRDWLVDLGLVGKDPEADLAVARSAWEAGNMAAAAEAATVVVGTMAVAPDAGRGRAVLTGGGVTVLVLLLLVLLVLARRRRNRRSPGAEADTQDAGISAP